MGDSFEYSKTFVSYIIDTNMTSSLAKFQASKEQCLLNQLPSNDSHHQVMSTLSNHLLKMINDKNMQYLLNEVMTTLSNHRQFRLKIENQPKHERCKKGTNIKFFVFETSML